MSRRRPLAALAAAAAVVALPAAAVAVPPATPAYLRGDTAQPGGEIAMTVNASLRLQTLQVFYSCTPGAEADRETRNVYELSKSKWIPVTPGGRFSKTIRVPTYEAAFPFGYKASAGKPLNPATLTISGRWVTKGKVAGTFRVQHEGCDTGAVAFTAVR